MLRKNNFDDSIVRGEVINFFKNKFKLELNETPQNLKLIDLTGSTETLIGVEVEGGGWSGDFWKNDNYSLISGLGYRTINIPIRKEKYWMEKFFKYKKERYNPSFNLNIFVRTNKDFTQMILIRPETICNPEKKIITKFQPNNSNEIEEWMSFKEEDVETYNLINGIWELNK